MASCDVQATPSNDDLENLVECPKHDASTTHPPIATDIAQAETPTEEAVDVVVNMNVNRNVESTKSTSNLPPPTKIPGPIHVGNGFNNRKYTTLMKSPDTKKQLNDSYSSTNTLVNVTEDSGIHMDCSTAEDENSNCRPSSSTPILGNSTETLAPTESFLQLDAAEQQTLLVLQRAVAEMEADVAMHSAQLEEEIKLEVKKQQPQQLVAEPTESKSSCEVVEGFANFPVTQGIQERKHVRVEELLKAEHDIEMLQKLLQAGSNEDVDLTQSASGSELIEGRGATRKQMGVVHSLFHIICGKSIRKLSYPILFCGMAVGLIFYFRKD